MRRVLLGCAAALALAFPAMADYRAEYREGVRAFEKGNWKEAATRMRAAIQENASEGEQILLYGTRRPKYVPHLYLAAALARSGDCGGAVTALERSEQQGQSAKAREYREMLPVIAPCRKQNPVGTVADNSVPADPPPPAGPDPAVVRAIDSAAEAIARAQSQQRALQTLKSDPAAAPIFRQWSQAREVESTAANELSAANSALGRARASGSAAEAQHAITLANTAATRLQSLQSDVGRRREAAALQASSEGRGKPADPRPAEDPRVGQARSELSKSVATARSLFRSLGGGSEALNRASSQLHQAIGEADSLSRSSSSSHEEIAAARTTLDSAVRAARQAQESGNRRAKASQPLPQPLLDGVNAFFKGDYQKTVGILASAAFPDRRADAQARLFAAAARYSLWVLGGRKDPQLLKLAAADVRRAKSLDTTLLPSASYFSPRFVAFFTEQR